ncbi:hypothetical protein SCP_0906290 [Sparassis crispa]|uniref:Uncharacterized protein n=1 Tax=Sparassis crispa TaxID=139825 RepID=A0A401GWZ0_9APHY|nr:hypothetical protein SCP_0906290 [Sparassis crispa]GBE86748.1 hypothetical protein SCP_0906290 [Sparassis crispa]
MFSPAQASGYSDIRIPLAQAVLEYERRYGRKPPREYKNDKIFWRGTSTGGGSSPAALPHSISGIGSSAW